MWNFLLVDQQYDGQNNPNATVFLENHNATDHIKNIINMNIAFTHNVVCRNTDLRPCSSPYVAPQRLWCRLLLDEDQ